MDFRNTPDIEVLYSGYIDAVNEDNRKKRYAGKEQYFHGSSAGMCSRKHYFAVNKVTKTNKPQPKSMRIMRLGTVVHNDFEEAMNFIETLKNEKKSSKRKERNGSNSLLSLNIGPLLSLIKDIKEIHTEKEIILEQYKVRGHYDMVFEMESGEIFLYDLKTIASYPYKLKFGRNPEMNQSMHQELQVATYGLAILEKFKRLDGMFLYYYNKDTSMLKQKEVPMTYLDQAERYWTELNNRIEMGLPPVDEGISPVHSWECNYCDFKDHCWETE